MRRMLVESSAIRSVGYDAAQRTLEIAFTSGRIYQYTGVEPGVVAELLDAESKGRYFREHIRPVYPYRRMRRPVPPMPPFPRPRIT